MTKVKAVIFDMDGVLIDAREWHYEALNRSLLYFGYEISRSDHISSYDGLPTRKKLELLSDNYGFPVSLHSFVNDLKQKFTMQIAHQKCVPSFNHKHALSQLKRDGYKLAVASNSISATVETMMELARLDEYLEFTLSNEDVTKPKPNPEIYNKAIENLGCLPEECLIVEDNAHGILAAKRSGAHVLEVPDPDSVSYLTIKNQIKNIEGCL